MLGYTLETTLAPSDLGIGTEADTVEGPRALSLVCVARRRETKDVVTFIFAEANGNALHHMPGQAVTLALPVDGEQIHRTFTISEASPAGDTIAVTVKAHEKALASAWLHAHCEVGTALEARGPHGRFTLGLRTQRGDIAFVSAGSGVTPMIAMLRALAVEAPETDVIWLHAARTPADALFSQAVADLQTIMPRLVAGIVVSKPTPGWFGFTGRISRRLLSVMAPDLARRDVFVCGPGGFIETVRVVHAAEGGDAARFHTEHFNTESLQTPHEAQFAFAASFTTGAGTRATLGQKVFTVAPGETLLQAASRQGVVIPCGCGRGMCGTCRVRLEAGEVRMAHEGGISGSEEAQGFILACSSRPLGDVRLAF